MFKGTGYMVLKSIGGAFLSLLLVIGTTYSEESGAIEFRRPPNKDGVNQFEPTKSPPEGDDNVVVRIGGASTIQYQALSHETGAFTIDTSVTPLDTTLTKLQPISPAFNLPTANLDLDVQLAAGMRMHLRTYLSAQHHPEAWVKGGYLQVDKLDFITPGFMEDVMNYLTFKTGMMEINYGDAHFRRTDNAMALYNPFVGNYIMDSFTTEVGLEAYVNAMGFLFMLGTTNSHLNQSVVDPGPTDYSLISKIGYDGELSDDLRIRLTGSVYWNGEIDRIYLYSGDRSGSRYYNVVETGNESRDNFRNGRFSPNLSDEITAVMINPFIKFMGLEVFGVIEFAMDAETMATQYAGDILYRLGPEEQFYVGGRYNLVGHEDISISRVQGVLGWFLTPNTLVKAEYVTQSYDGYSVGVTGTATEYEASFNGFMVESTIAF